MKWNWHTIGGGLASLIAWVGAYVNPAGLGHTGAVVVGVLGTLLAAFSRPAVERGDSGGVKPGG